MVKPDFQGFARGAGIFGRYIALARTTICEHDLWYDGRKFICSLLRGKGRCMPCLLLTAFLAMVAGPIQTPTTPPTQSPSAKSTVTTATIEKSAPGSVAGQTAANAAVSPTDAVITIHGLCAAQSGAQSDPGCTKVVTRQQFDAVVNALNAIGAPLLLVQRRAVAEGYAATLMNYEAAKKAGVERDPRFAEVMRLARMRAMGDMYKALQEEKAKKVTPEEIQTYYKNNLDTFEELTIRRVILPRYNQANLRDEEFAARASTVANDIHDRMAKGEDLDKLQKEAFDA